MLGGDGAVEIDTDVADSKFDPPGEVQKLIDKKNAPPAPKP